MQFICNRSLSSINVLALCFYYCRQFGGRTGIMENGVMVAATPLSKDPTVLGIQESWPGR